MGQLDKQPENSQASDPKAAEVLLSSMTQDLENLRQNLLSQFSQDVERLQKEKSQLIEDIEQLRNQRQQQARQQQQLVRQLAPALANQLSEQLRQQLDRLPQSSPTESRQPLAASASDYDETVYRLIASLDTTLRTTFRTLQQDLSSYQSSLSQQLGQMYSLEQQGEAILETLVNRLREEIQANPPTIEAPPPPPPTQPRRPTPPPPTVEEEEERNRAAEAEASTSSKKAAPTVPVVPEPEPPAAVTQPPPKQKKASKLQIGFVLVLLSALALSFQNVVVAIILNPSQIFGVFQVGGFISPSVGNSLLILWLRMVVVVPLMAALATVLYPNVWRDIRQFIQSNDRPLWINVLGSGFFLFLSQVLIYMALGPLSPGIAVTIFFLYPIVTALLAWVLFGDRPSKLRFGIIALVTVGVVLTALPIGMADNLPAEGTGGGILAAVGSGIAFACYVVLTQACAKKLHPIPFSWLNFAVILVFASLSLAVLPEAGRFEVGAGTWSSLIVSSLILGGTTLVSYLLNNIGISLIGAARASILGATGPALTALLAWIIIQSDLRGMQIVGMLLVTIGVTALSFERFSQRKKAPSAAPK
jgi:drug/metabolite transporter (DMT)-like permease